MRDESATDLLELWACAARTHAAEPAIVDGDGGISFAQLDGWSEALAAELRAHGTRPGEVIGICAERSAAAVAAILAVFKCGAVYLPIEPHLPPARQALMMADARPRLLLAGDGVTLPTGIPALRIASQRASPPGAGAAAAFAATRALYLLYTSGSSGAPKGVLGTHHGLMNRLRWMWRRFPFTGAERVAHRTPLGFVDSVAEVWGALLAGVPIVLIPQSIVADVDALITEIGLRGVSRLVVVPSLLETMLHAGRRLDELWPRLSMCVTSGETLPAAVAQGFHAALPGRSLVNLYGMTEAAADATWSLVEPSAAGATVRIGQPIEGMQVYVLDDELNRAHPGEAGQIHLAGEGLAQGYFGRPALSAEKFLPDPFQSGARMYATGDFGRWCADGELEYLGRRDGQVKVRGHRVELGEMERATLLHPAIAQCVAGLTLDGGDLQLIVVVRAGTQVTARALKDHLRQRLPAYMVPAFVHVRDAMPLLPNGKIDRRMALQATAEPLSGAPLTSASQRRIALVWQELLRIDAVGSDGNFFDLGGNSLNAALAVTRLRGEFGVGLSVAEFLERESLAELAAMLDQRVAVGRVRAGGALAEDTEVFEF